MGICGGKGIALLLNETLLGSDLVEINFGRHAMDLFIVELKMEQIDIFEWTRESIINLLQRQCPLLIAGSVYSTEIIQID